jgi:Kef-type K+ transport system membrane component KefB
MHEPAFSGLLLVVAVAFAAPFLLGFFPSVRLPAVVLEITAGIAIGPAGLGWVEIDETISVLATIGLVFLLFLAGLEVEFDKLRGRLLRVAGGGWLLSFGIAVVAGLALKAGGLAETPLLVAVILSATSLGVIIPVLKDAGEIASRFGQLVVAAGSIADFGAIILLSVLFAGEGGTGATLVLIGGLLALAGTVFFVVRGAERSKRIGDDLLRLQDTTAQIRVRGATTTRRTSRWCRCSYWRSRSCAAFRPSSTGRLSAPGEPPSRASSRQRRCRSSSPRRRSDATWT